MNYRIVTDALAIDPGQWERFVFEHPMGNVFQTPQMYVAYKATKNYQPMVVACYDKDSLAGILLAVVQKEYAGILGKLSARSIIWGGPLVRENNPDILNLLMDAYDKRVEAVAVYSQAEKCGGHGLGEIDFSGQGIRL